MRQARNCFAVVRLGSRRDDERVGDNRVDIGSAGGAGITEVVDLQRRRAMGENPHSAAAGMPHQVDGDINLHLPHELGDGAVRSA